MANKAERIKLTTPEFRGSYVNLVKPRAQKQDDGTMSDPKYGLLIALKKDDPKTVPFLKQLMAAIQATSAAVHGVAGGIPKEKLKHYPIKDGKTMEGEQFEDFYVIRASSKSKPDCIDKTGRQLISDEDLYSGAVYMACIAPFAWSNERGGKGVSIGLNSVLKVRDDEKFGNKGDAKGDFSAFLEAGSTEEDPLANI